MHSRTHSTAFLLLYYLNLSHSLRPNPNMFLLPHSPGSPPPFPVGPESCPFSGLKMPTWPSYSLLTAYCLENKTHNTASPLEMWCGVPASRSPTHPPQIPQQAPISKDSARNTTSSTFSPWPPLPFNITFANSHTFNAGGISDQTTWIQAHLYLCVTTNKTLNFSVF